MACCEDLELTDVNIIDSNIDNSDKFTSNETFYNSPLCKSGYLTPLQRKKLREKRSLDDESGENDLSSFKKVKKSRLPKLKKQQCINTQGKRPISRKKTKENIPQIHCVVSKIFHKLRDDNVADKKFFKTSPSSRLEKANFTISLVLNKKALSDFDRSNKIMCSNARKKVLHKKYIHNSGIESDNQDFDSIHSQSDTSINPCAIRVQTINQGGSKSNFSDKIIENADVSSKSVCLSNEKGEELQFSEEKSIFDFDWPSDEILLKRQEKARAVIKEKSILKESNVLEKTMEIENNQILMSNCTAPIKLFPIFQMAIKKQKNFQDSKRNEKNTVKFVKDSSSGGEQMIIDAGQKEIGAKICSTCNMIYTVGLEKDENLHTNYHNMYLVNLKFLGWKEENVIGEYCDGRIIMVRKDDKILKLKKIADVLEIANRDLGFPSAGFPTKPDLTFVIFVSSSDKQVAGCVVAESISSACQVLLAENNAESFNAATGSNEKVWKIGNWYSSSESVPAVCGINRIWVARNFRRQKVASRMIDCLRCHFIHGHVIGIRELAFTDPSPDGREFAASYTGTDHFLVYK